MKNTPKLLTRFPRGLQVALLVLSVVLVASPAMADPTGGVIAAGFAGTLLTAAQIAGLTIRDAIDRRLEVKKELDALEGQESLDEEADQRFDGLLEELKLLDGDIEKKQNRKAERSAALAGVASSPPQREFRGAEPNNDRQQRDDIVDNPPASYSLMKAIQERMSGELTGVEAEISQEIALRTGKTAQGFFLPTALQTRDLDMTAGVGAQQTGTASTLIDLLRNRSRVRQLGATVMSGMVGTFDLPKQTGAGTAGWVTEGNAPSESNQTIGQVALAPNTVGAFTNYSRRFVNQTSIDAEQFVRNDLMTVLALELDRACINGSGAGAEPEGILQNSNIPTVDVADPDGGAPDRDDLINLETEVNQDNADGNNMAFLTNSKVKGKLKQTAIDAGSGLFVWESGDMLVGYSAAVSNQVPSNLTKGAGTDLSAIIFGDWASLIIALWSGIDVIVNPYALDTAGGVRVSMLQDADIAFRHEEAFAKIVDADTT